MSRTITLAIITILLASCKGPTIFTLENEYISHTFTIDGGKLQTKEIKNYINDEKLIPEYALGIDFFLIKNNFLKR